MAVCSAGVSAGKPGSVEKLIIFALDLVTGVFGRKGLKTVTPRKEGSRAVAG